MGFLKEPITGSLKSKMAEEGRKEERKKERKKPSF